MVSALLRLSYIFSEMLGICQSQASIRGLLNPPDAWDLSIPGEHPGLTESARCLGFVNPRRASGAD
ncbi:hypothetical protein QUF80_09870 [Desulfococcaceae bacterium HSG8]|nr:hypothetical protein [Desulfococcaceae bacterium HSG8]